MKQLSKELEFTLTTLNAMYQYTFRELSYRTLDDHLSVKEITLRKAKVSIVMDLLQRSA